MAINLAKERLRFAEEDADAIARSVGIGVKAKRLTTGWTKRVVWYETDDRLAGLIGAQEQGYADIGLAHGLHLAAGRQLVLVLPKEWARPTVQRVPWLAADVEVYTYLDGQAVRRAVLPSRDRTSLNAGGPEKAPDRHLGAVGEHVRDLSEWAACHPDLDSAHHTNLRAWTCRGQRVLALTGSKTKVTVAAGINAKSQAADKWIITAQLDEATFARIKEQVEAGIHNAKTQKHGKFEEHNLQSILRRTPDSLGLEYPVLREVPAWRPSGGDKSKGRGFIDLVGMDGLGDVTIVETKLAGDDMLVLQGLDYWIWANAAGNAQWLRERLHADPTRSSLRLMYAVGGRGGKAPTLGKYATAQLQALREDVSWRLALINNWTKGKPDVKLLKLRTKP